MWLNLDKQKEPITQSIRNRREHSSRFKMMFYVIGSEESKSGSASYSSRQQNQRRGGAVRHFRCTDTVSDEPTNYVSIWSNISIQLLCSGVLLCHYYTDYVLCRQGCKSLSLYSELQRTKINGSRKVLLLVRTFSEKYQRAKIILSNLGRIFKTNFPTTCREYKSSLPTKLVGSLKSHFCPTWTEVKNHFAAICNEVG